MEVKRSIPCVFHDFEQVHVDAVGSAVRQGTVLRLQYILIADLPHASVMEGPADPLVVVEALRVVRDEDQGVRLVGPAHAAHVTAAEDWGEGGIVDFLAD